MSVRHGVLYQKHIFEYDVGLWTFGTVQVVAERQTGVRKVCKVVPKALIRDAYGEVPANVVPSLQRLCETQHKHICGISEVVEDSTHIYIISNWCQGGDVGGWMTSVLESGYWLQEATVAEYVRHVLLALIHSHAYGVYHGDLRPESLLLTSKLPDAEVHVSELGLAAILDPSGLIIRRNPSPYTAPEVLSGEAIWSPCLSAPDMWSVGAIAHTLLVGHPPGRDGSWAGGGFFRAQDATSSDAWAGRSKHSRSFVFALLGVAANRLSAARALQHPWLNRAVRFGTPSSSSTDAVTEVRSKTSCYMLAVLLLPDAIKVENFAALRSAHAQLDRDVDGLVAKHQIRTLLQSRGMSSEAAAAALDIVDVRNTESIDLCAAACAEIIGSGLRVSATSKLADVVTKLIHRFFQSYGDSQHLTARVSDLQTKLGTSAMQVLELHAGLQYEEILHIFPDGEDITADSLLSSLADSDGCGTPLAIELETGDDSLTLWRPHRDMKNHCGVDGFEHFLREMLDAAWSMRISSGGA